MFWAKGVIHVRGVGYLQLEASPPKGCFCLEMVFCLVGTHAPGLCLGLMVTVYGQLFVPCDMSMVCNLRLTSMVSCLWYLRLLMSVVDIVGGYYLHSYKGRIRPRLAMRSKHSPS